MRVLIVKLTSLGDVIHTLPAVTDLAHQIDQLEICWLVEESFQLIPGWHPAVSTVFTAASRRWRKQPGQFVKEIRKLSQQLKQQPFDVIIDAQGLLKSATLSRLAQGLKVGYDKASIKESAASHFYDKKINVNKDQHAIVRTRELFAKAFNYSFSQSIDYGLSKDDFPDPQQEQDYLIFLHGTTWLSKQWPLEYWQDLADIAVRNGYQIKLLWGNESERIRAQQIARQQNCVQVCPKMDLFKIAGLISHAKGIVAVDTGLGHLTAALSVPCVNLYGATDSVRTGTIGNLQKQLQAEFVCSPCFRKQCDYQGASEVIPACFGQFDPQFVWQQLQQSMNVKK